MTLSRTFSGGAAALWLACGACSGADAQRRGEAFEAEGRARHPEAGWIVGFGEGDTRAEAETAARAAAAATVKSRVMQRFAALQEERVKDGRSVSEHRVVNEVVSEVDSAFGAYFKAAEARELGRRWRAMALASRTELDAAIEAEAERKTRAAEAAWRRIADSTGWLAAAPGWCEARSAAEALDGLDLQRQAVTGKSVWTPERRARWSAAAKRFADAKGRIVTVVAPAAGAGAPDAAPPLVAALQQAGWRAEQGAGACSGDVALVVEPKVEGSCRRSSLGIEVCSASLLVEGHACGGGAVFSERSPAASATHGTDPAQALRRATSQIAVQPVVDRARVRILAALGEGCGTPR